MRMMLPMIAHFHEKAERHNARAVSAPPHAKAIKWATLSKCGIEKPIFGNWSPDCDESQ